MGSSCLLSGVEQYRLNTEIRAYHRQRSTQEAYRRKADSVVLEGVFSHKAAGNVIYELPNQGPKA